MIQVERTLLYSRTMPAISTAQIEPPKPSKGLSARIYHGPFNIAGIPGLIARAERAMGLQSTAICFPAGAYDRDVDRRITAFTADEAVNAFMSHDIFNFHFGHTLLGDGLGDLPLLKFARKTVLMHFHGCDIRDSKHMQRTHRINTCQACWPMACNSNRNQARAAGRELGPRAIVYTPDLKEFLPDATFLPQPVDVRALDAAAAEFRLPERDPGIVRLVHAPSSVDLKGTAFVVGACDRLRAKGVPIELRLVTGKPHREVLEEIANADFVVDQLLAGAHGVFAVEAMALGVPTIAYIRDDLRGLYPPDFPVISATPEGLSEVVGTLLDDRDSWKGLGVRSRAYAQREHDMAQVAARLAKLYA